MNENCQCLRPLKNPPSLNSFSPFSSGPTPTSATPLALKSASSLLISVAIQRHTWQPNLRRKNKTTGWSCQRDRSSTLCITQRGEHSEHGTHRWHMGNSDVVKGDHSNLIVLVFIIHDRLKQQCNICIPWKPISSI